MTGKQGKSAGKGDKQNAAKALVLWVGGKDDGQYQIIDKEWLKNFDVEAWRQVQVEDRETEVAEWRVGKKKNGSWKVYDCKVVNIGSSQDLKKEMLQLQEEKDKENQSDDDKSSDDEEKEDSELSGGDDDGEALTAKQEREIKRKSASKVVENLKDETKRLKLALAEAVMRNSNGTRDVLPKPKEPNDTDEIKVPLYPDSTVLVPKSALDAAKTSGNRSSFVGDMLVQMFPRSILVVSNITGAKSKGSGDGLLHRWALNNKKRLALIGAANHYFPGVKDSQVHNSIMNRINRLRHTLKEKGELTKYEEMGKELMKDVPHTNDVLAE